MVSKAFFTEVYEDQAPFIRPLSILTDQLLEASIKDVSLL